MTTGRGFATMRWSESSSAFTPTGRTRALGRIPDWGCRSRNRSSKPMADASGRKIAPVRSAPMARRRSRARALWSGCPRHDARQGLPSVHASAVLVGNRAVLIRGPSGAGKSRLAFDLILAGRCGQIPSAVLVGDDRVHLGASAGANHGAAGARTGRPDRNPRARHSPLRLRRRGRGGPGRRSGGRGRRAPAARRRRS